MSNHSKKKQRSFGVSSLLASATGRAEEETSDPSPTTADEEGGKPAESAGAEPSEASTPSETAAEPQADADAPVAEHQESEETHRGGHQKTAKGYVRADGSERRRKSLFLPAHQIQALEFLAVRGGYSDKVSQFIADELDLEEVAREMGFR